MDFAALYPSCGLPNPRLMRWTKLIPCRCIDSIRRRFPAAAHHFHREILSVHEALRDDTVAVVRGERPSHGVPSLTWMQRTFFFPMISFIFANGLPPPACLALGGAMPHRRTLCALVQSPDRSSQRIRPPAGRVIGSTTSINASRSADAFSQAQPIPWLPAQEPGRSQDVGKETL
jgi:hypothetical protein